MRRIATTSSKGGRFLCANHVADIPKTATVNASVMIRNSHDPIHLARITNEGREDNVVT